MINFIPATLTEIYKLISASESKQCPLDSIPTFLLKLCFNELGPIITNLVNLSLSEGNFPSSFKQALVQPLLKKPSLSTDDLNNFRPISNLIFISKILEKVVASRIQSHLSSNSLSSSFQSAYRIFHSTETTLLKIHNDLILAMDRGEVTSLILLDLSAAFDTVDHSILLTHLRNWFGLDGLSLDWFSSYLSLRSQAVSINDSISAFSTLSCGVPQGSVLGPLFFTLYTTPLGSVISKNSLKYHLYADDTQLYISFTPTNSALSLETLTTTFNDILSWMNLNKLLLNPSKTEFLLIGTKQQRLKFSDLTNLSLSNDIIPVSSSAHNLGFIFDSDMSFSDQINFVSKSCQKSIKLKKIKKLNHIVIKSYHQHRRDKTRHLFCRTIIIYNKNDDNYIFSSFQVITFMVFSTIASAVCAPFFVFGWYTTPLAWQRIDNYCHNRYYGAGDYLTAQRDECIYAVSTVHL